MSHPYSGNKSSDVAKRRASKISGMKAGGHTDAKADAKMVKKAMGAHDKQLHGGKHTDLGVIGEYAKGGRTKKKKGDTQINIAIIGGEKKDDTLDVGMPPAGAMPPPPPPGPPMPPPGAMPAMAGPPPGMPPKPPGMMKRGGKVPMRGGAESGVGRLDKVKAYRKG